ncbi:hypothetical protein HY745_01825 [Candidatus Desantisbacteria bacterium]|nr:hypothetical protein [Candidatus Desantisbacteria bacterium]
MAITFMGIEYTLHEIFDLIFVLLLTMTLPVGIIRQIYLAVKGSFDDTTVISPAIINKKTVQKRKKQKSK